MKISNTAELETVFHAINAGNCTIKVQPFDASRTGNLWTINYTKDGFWIGQGDTMAEAINGLRNTDNVGHRTAVSAVEQVAA